MEKLVAEVLAEVKAMRAEQRGPGLPLVLTMKRAAYELSVSLTTLKALIRASEVLTVMVGKRRMVPASEVRRHATPEPPNLVRARPVKSELQDSELLRASLR